MQAAPYINMSDDMLASTLSFFLVVVFLTSCIFKYSALIDLKDIRRTMSKEQQNLYVLSPTVLVGICLASLIG